MDNAIRGYDRPTGGRTTVAWFAVAGFAIAWFAIAWFAIDGGVADWYREPVGGVVADLERGPGLVRPLGLPGRLPISVTSSHDPNRSSADDARQVAADLDQEPVGQ